MSAGVKSFSTLAVALVIFGLASSVIAVTAPRLFTGPERPGFIVFFTVGVAVILLTAGLFAYIYHLGLGLGKTVLVLAAGYNALIAAVKFALAPAALYQANQEQTFDASVGDPNSLWFYLAVSSAVLLLYLLVFRVMYGLFKRRFRRQGLEIAAPRERRSRWGDRRRVVLIAVVVAAVALLASFLWVIPVFFVGLPTVSYLVYVFSTFGAVITLALILAAILAYKAFDEVEKRAVLLGDATLLATFFWLGCALIFLYHAMWVVFLLTLISIWPFQTYTPK